MQLVVVGRVGRHVASRVFRDTLGITPKQCLVRARCQVAARRLREDDTPVYAIAEEVGFPDVYSFSRQFKAVMGMTPSAYRRREGG